MPYTPQTWADGEAGGTPITAARLNAMESGIDTAHDTADAAETPAGAQAKVDAHEAEADPHAQYHTDARGDARYYTQAQVDAALDGKAPVGAVAVRVYRTTTQSIPTATVTAIEFDAETTDPDGFHSTVTNTSRLTVPAGKAGLYIISAGSGIAFNATGTRQTRIHINGALQAVVGVNAVTSTGIPTRNDVADVARLSDGDYVELFVFQDSGGNLNAEANLCRLSLVRIGD